MVLTTELLGIKNSLAEKREKKVKADNAKGKFHYPNPVFWRTKDNMDFKAQGKNLMEIGKICVEMFKEADKKGFCMKQVERCRNDLERCAQGSVPLRREDSRKALPQGRHGPCKKRVERRS